MKVRGVEEDDFRPSVHFCVLPSCFFVTMSHSGDSFWLCFAFNGRRCFPAFNGVVQKYLDPSMALDRFSLICPFSFFFFASCCHIFCQRSSVFRFQKTEHLHVRIISHHSLERFESECFHEICSSRCLFFALLRKMRGSKQLARGGLRTQKSIGHMQKTHFLSLFQILVSLFVLMIGNRFRQAVSRVMRPSTIFKHRLPIMHCLCLRRVCLCLLAPEHVCCCFLFPLSFEWRCSVILHDFDLTDGRPNGRPS